jgi:hypothetical protein
MSQIPASLHIFPVSFSRAKQFISLVISFLSYKLLAAERHTHDTAIIKAAEGLAIDSQLRQISKLILRKENSK